MKPALPLPALPAIALAMALGPALACAAGTTSPGFASLDRDGNGAISRAEFLELRKAMFARIDADGSGTITRAEIEAARARLPQGSSRRGEDRIWAQDANRDGKLTLAEYTTQTRGFDMADRNGDGVLSPAEFERVARFLGQLPR